MELFYCEATFSYDRSQLVVPRRLVLPEVAGVLVRSFEKGVGHLHILGSLEDSPSICSLYTTLPPRSIMG